jgi:hypothetical protein
MEEILTRAVELGILTLGGAFSLVWREQRSKEKEIFERLRQLEIQVSALQERGSHVQ